MEDLLDELEKLPDSEHFSNFENDYMTIKDFEKAIKLLKHLNPDLISKGEEINDGRNACLCCDGHTDTYFDVCYEGRKLLRVTRIDTELLNSGVSGRITLESPLFDELYYAPEAPGYQEALDHFGNSSF